MIKKIYKKIKEFDEIVIARHIGPDPDAVSSQIALRDSIRLTFPNKKVFAVGARVSRFKYLGLLDKVDQDKLVKPLLIIVDNPIFDRVDGIDYKKFDQIILIDHHPKEDVYNLANVSYVDESASSAAQLVAKLILNTKLKINESIASKLFIGIVADSDRFLLNYTSSSTFKIVAELMEKYPIKLGNLYNKLYERPLSELKFKGYIFSNINVTENGFGYIKLNQKILDEMGEGVDASSASNMVNDLNYIKELYVWAFSTFDEKSKLHRVNIRSRGPIINEVASKYNGGGHKLASGARIENIEDVDALFKDLDNECKKYKELIKDENKEI